MEIVIERLDPTEFDKSIADLGELLVRVVEAGASVGFLRGLTRARAEEFWRSLLPGIEQGSTTFIGARIDGSIRGSAIINRGKMENGTHRAEINKVLVHPEFRRRGIGAELMRCVETEAQRSGITLLVLDTETKGQALRMYRRLGWVEVGEIPYFALSIDGTPVSTTVMYRRLTLDDA